MAIGSAFLFGMICCFGVWSDILAWRVGTRDLLVKSPVGWCVVVGCAFALAAFFSVKVSYRFAKPFGWLQLVLRWQLGLIVLACLGIGIAGFIDHYRATLSPTVRAQITSIQSTKGISTTYITLADGRKFKTTDYPAREFPPFGRCLVVRPRWGHWGFSWLSIVDASPLPAPGRLATRIEPEDCFSNTKLSDL